MNELKQKNGLLSINQIAILISNHGELLNFDLKNQNSSGEYAINQKKFGIKYATGFLEFLEKMINVN